MVQVGGPRKAATARRGVTQARRCNGGDSRGHTSLWCAAGMAVLLPRPAPPCVVPTPGKLPQAMPRHVEGCSALPRNPENYPAPPQHLEERPHTRGPPVPRSLQVFPL